MTRPRQRGLTEQAADAAIDTACRILRLPSIRKEFSETADRALKEQMSYRGFLAELLMAECDDQARRRTERRIKAANLPREKSLRSFDFSANSNIDAATVHTLASCEWVEKGQPLCLIGDSSTGKSHQTIARYGRVDLLCIDELDYMELDRHGAELPFQVLTECEEKNSVAIASNESFGGCTKTFTDPRLCAAIVDRLTFDGTIIETGTDSYRLASTRAKAGAPAKAG
ncbi:ATP-binding protein [Streptomyces sp. NPDC002676]